jgi:hypothetical protein
MKVNIYIAETGLSFPRYGFLPPQKPVSFLARGESWRYVRSGDTGDFNLPEVVEEEIKRRGFWTHTFGS